MAFWSNFFQRRRQRQLAKAEANLLSSGSWLSQRGYQGGSEQFDPNAPAVQIPVYGIAPPTLVLGINAAVARLEQGTFYAADYLWDGMSRDERLAATLNTRLSGLFGERLDLEPGKDTARGRRVKEDLEKLIGRMLPTHQLKQFAGTALGQSVAVAQVLTTRTAKSTTPTVRVWKNRFLRFDWLLRKYCLVTENRGEIAIEPGDPEWIVYEPYGPYGWLNGALIRPLALPWLIRYWTRSWWARYQEVHGQPIRVGVIPAERKPADERLFLAQLSNLAHEAVIRLPTGTDGNKFDVRLVEAQANSWQGFKALLEHCDNSIAVAILGQQQSTAGQGGLGTQEKAGESTIVRLLRMDSLIGETLREQFIKKWTADNYGDPELAPYLKWQIDPPEDQDKKAGAILKFAQAVSSFATAPAFARHIDIRQLLEDNDFPLVPEDQVPPDVPNTPNPPLDDSNQVNNGTTQENGNPDGIEPADGTAAPADGNASGTGSGKPADSGNG